MTLFLCIVAICCWFIAVSWYQPDRVWLAKRIMLALMFALFLAAALKADDGATTNVIVRGHLCVDGWFWCPW